MPFEFVFPQNSYMVHWYTSHNIGILFHLSTYAMKMKTNSENLFMNSVFFGFITVHMMSRWVKK